MFLQGFAERLRAARAAAHLTQLQVASVLGCTPDTVANYEHARTEPGLADVRRLATLYRVSVDWLVSGSPKLPHRFEAASPHAALARCEHMVPVSERCDECEGIGASA